MNASEARASALTVLRARLAKGATRKHLAEIVYEGCCLAHGDGYLVRAGRITVPAFGQHSFRLADLFSEIDSPQTELFA